MMQNNSGLQAASDQEIGQKVVVLDDDRLSSHNIGIQLRFVGETPLFSTSDKWQQLFGTLSENRELENVIAIALGVIKSYALIDLLNTLHTRFPNIPLLLLNNQEEIQYSLLPEALQSKFMPLGDKSLNYRSLLVALQNARELGGRADTRRPSNIISETGTAMFRSLAGQSESMQKVRQLVQAVAIKPVTALVLGESGTGKEIVARNLHYHSGRSEKPFVVVNCTSVQPDRQGVELFGQEKNVQGGLESVEGLIERAQGGTLFLDDVAELPLNVQGMLLRFLEDKKVQRMGSHNAVNMDVRVVAATRHKLEDKIRQGNFRQDLYYRLSVVPIEIPPLRTRVQDIPDLIKELLSRLENKEHSSIRFNSAALQSLQLHSWPGNVRELANLVERMCIIKPNEVIGISDLPQEYQYVEDGQRTNVETSASPGKVSGADQGARTSDTNQASATAQTESERAAESASQHGGNKEASSAGGQPASANVQAAASGQNKEPPTISQPAGKQAAENLAMVPLNAQRLEQYLGNFEKNLLEVAMLDSANIMKFAADRLKLDENTLREKLQRHGLA